MLEIAPRGWIEARIGDLCLPVEKVDPRKAPDNVISYIDIGSIDAANLVIASTTRIRGAEAPSRARQLVKAGDILFSTVRTYLKKAAIVPRELDGSIASTGFCVLRPGTAVSSAFLLYRLVETKFVAEVSALQTGSSYPAIRNDDLLNRTILLPPLAEQHRIVTAIEEQLSRIDNAEGALRRAGVRIERLRRTRMRAAVEGPLVPFGALLVEPLCNGRSVPTAPEGFPVLRLTALREGRVDLTQRKIGAWTRAEATRFLVRSGDFLIARGNGSLSLVGRGGLVESEPDEVAFPDTMIRARVDRTRLQPAFLRLVWDTDTVRQQIVRAARTTAGIYKVNQQDLERIKIPVPALSVQEKLVEQLDRQFSIVNSLANSISHSFQHAKRLRASILDYAFSGHLVPQDPADEPVSGLLTHMASSVVPDNLTRRRVRA